MLSLDWVTRSKITFKHYWAQLNRTRRKCRHGEAKRLCSVGLLHTHPQIWLGRVVWRTEDHLSVLTHQSEYGPDSTLMWETHRNRKEMYSQLSFSECSVRSGIHKWAHPASLFYTEEIHFMQSKRVWSISVRTCSYSNNFVIKAVGVELKLYEK